MLVIPETMNTYQNTTIARIVLKYALTCAVRGAILANKNSSIKLFYRKISKKGVSPQKVLIAAARKNGMYCMRHLTRRGQLTITK
jgi:hypothetical protein